MSTSRPIIDRIRRLAIALALWVTAAIAPSAAAEADTVRIARQYGIGYLQIVVMEHEKLLEKHAKAQGIPDLKVTWHTYADGTVANDGILSGNLDFVAGGLGSFVTLWDRTRGLLDVKGVAALNSMPMLLNSRNPAVRSIRDFTDADRIALAGVKVSSQAVTLQLAAAQAFGEVNWNKLDPLTVNMAHPTAMQALLGGRGEVTAHFTSPPYQYDELAQPGVHSVLNSYDVWGGPQTFILAWTTSKFRDQNPKLYAAFQAALAEATDIVNRQRLAAAAMYIRISGDKSKSAEDLAKMLSDPQLRFTLTPENVLKFTAFKARNGTIRAKPESWKDLFFPEIQTAAGS
jgi:NitT/TauT family transport system substrate-binding protein